MEKEDAYINRNATIFALVIIIETINYPKLEDYWAQYWPFSIVTFPRVMSRDRFSLILKDRFSLILKFLYINEEKGQKQNGEPGYDPLYKIRPLITSVISNFQASYKPWMRPLLASRAEFGFTYLKNK